jgi:hypothetical protein
MRSSNHITGLLGNHDPSRYIPCYNLIRAKDVEMWWVARSRNGGMEVSELTV